MKFLLIGIKMSGDFARHFNIPKIIQKMKLKENFKLRDI